MGLQTRQILMNAFFNSQSVLSSVKKTKLTQSKIARYVTYHNFFFQFFATCIKMSRLKEEELEKLEKKRRKE